MPKANGMARASTCSAVHSSANQAALRAAELDMRRFTYGGLAVALRVLPVLALGGWLAARAVTQVALAWSGMALGATTLGSPPPAPDPLPTTASPATLSAIRQRNIFCSDCPTSSLEPVQHPLVNSPIDSAAELPTSSLPYELAGTLLSRQSVDGPHGPSRFALLRARDSGRVRLAAVGQVLAQGAELLRIEARRVVIRREGGLEQIGWDASAAETVATRTSRSSSRRGADGTSLARQIADGVRKVAEGRWQIERKALDHVLGNLHRLGRELRIVPSVNDGQPNGFKLLAIKPGSVPDLIGLRRGDRIEAINGRPIRNVTSALQLLAGLRTASHIRLAVARRGEPATLEYLIR
jgi:hypothetical protein